VRAGFWEFLLVRLGVRMLACSVTYAVLCIAVHCADKRVDRRCMYVMQDACMLSHVDAARRRLHLASPPCCTHVRIALSTFWHTTSDILHSLHLMYHILYIWHITSDIPHLTYYILRCLTYCLTYWHTTFRHTTSDILHSHIAHCID